MIQGLETRTIRNRIGDVADFFRALKDGDLTPTFPSKELAEDILSAPDWSFPALDAVTRSPVLRPDGSVLSDPGYDAATQLVYVPSPRLCLPTIPDSPNLKQVQQGARWILRELFSDFPFDSSASRANMLGLLLTPILRPAISGPVPLALIDAPQAGTGKSKLGEIVAAVTLGRPAEMHGAPHDEKEWRKVILAALLEGPTLVIFDNVMGKVSSGELSRAITASVFSDRVLGISRVAHLPVRTTWAITGNNIILGGDLPRRAYQIRIDAEMAKPWLRHPDAFRHPDILAWIAEQRGKVLTALLAMARAWFVAGCPAPSSPVLGSFEHWSRVVGGTLEFAGVDFLGNLDRLYDEMDIEAEQWGPFLAGWSTLIGNGLTARTSMRRPSRILIFETYCQTS